MGCILEDTAAVFFPYTRSLFKMIVEARRTHNFQPWFQCFTKYELLHFEHSYKKTLLFHADSPQWNPKKHVHLKQLSFTQKSSATTQLFRHQFLIFTTINTRSRTLSAAGNFCKMKKRNMSKATGTWREVNGGEAWRG